MSGITTITGQVAPLNANNVDTDQIIPKQFLTAVSRKGFGKHLFHDWRYIQGDVEQPNPDFVLNKPAHRDASILLSRQNFGCGSSREHAPWALADFGFKAVIAESFADIFYSNSINNLLLPVVLAPTVIEDLFTRINQDPSLTISIDLPNQQVVYADQVAHFSLSPAHKTMLIEGLDAIGKTLRVIQKIKDYETRIPSWF